MGLFDWLKRIFFRKKEQTLKKQELKKEQVFEEKKQEPSQLSIALEYIGKNRDKIIQEKKDNELKILPLQENGRFILLNKKVFQIDDEDLELF